MSCYNFVDQQRAAYPVPRLGRLLQVAPARYYAWRQQRTTARSSPEPVTWEEALEQAFTRHQKRYGTRRLRVELREESHRVGRQRLRMAMRVWGPRVFTPCTTDSTHGLRCAPTACSTSPRRRTPTKCG